MKTGTLIKLNNELILCNEEDVTGAIGYNPESNEIEFFASHPKYNESGKRIIAKSIDIIFTKKFAEEIGWVNVEELALKEANAIQQLDEYSKGRWYGIIQGYNTGFNKSQELNKDKYSLNDIKQAIEMAKEGTIGYYAPDSPTYYFDNTEDDIIKSLSKSQWEIEYTKTNGKFTVTKIIK